MLPHPWPQVEKEAALVNHEMNANKRSAAELVRRLSRREVDLEKERLERWQVRTPTPSGSLSEREDTETA
jgi:hypothetical protein